MFKRMALFIVFIGFVAFWCTAQSAPVDPKLVGTWTDFVNRNWVFNANGTGTRGGDSFIDPANIE